MSNIAYLNQPRMSKHEVDSVRNQRRLDLVPEIDTFLKKHPLFKDKEIKVFFAEKGVTSLVSIIETPEEKLVLKVPLREEPVDAEGAFLKEWEKVGVLVPHVIEEGSIGKYHYTLMSFVDALNLRDFYKLGGLVREKVFVEMGKILRQMHTTVAQGNGYVTGTSAKYPDFKSWITDAETLKYTKEVIDLKLLSASEHGSLEMVCKTLIEYEKTDSRSTYCHDDFAPENIFATQPVFTVFDPVPMFNHPFLDLGRTIVIAVSRCGPEAAADQLLEGYFQNESYDKRAVHAAIVLQTYLKFSYWNKTSQEKRIANVQEYLAKTIGRLL